MKKNISISDILEMKKKSVQMIAYEYSSFRKNTKRRLQVSFKPLQYEWFTISSKTFKSCKDNGIKCFYQRLY